MKDLSIIIVSWNTKDLLDKCVSSIYQHTKDIDYEIIISDNGSLDGSLEMIKKKYPEIILIENNENLGFGKANNLALKYCRGKCFLFLNSDTEIVDNSIKVLYDYLNSSNRIGACGGKLLYPDMSVQLSYGYFPTFCRIIWITISGILHLNINRKPLGVVPYNVDMPLKVDYIVGADLMVKSEVIKNVGAFDERFFAYFEETDLCFRIKKFAYEVWYVPDSNIIHIFGGSFKKLSDTKLKIFTQSQFTYYKKNLGFYKPIKYYFLFNYLIKIILFRFVNKGKCEEYKNMYTITKKIVV